MTKQSAYRKLISSKAGWLLMLLVLVAINYLASLFHGRLDLTREKRYTLSAETKKLVRSLDEELHIDIFLKGDFPAKFRKLTNGVAEFAELLKDADRKKVSISFIDPLENMEGTIRTYADTLVSMGASPINLKAQVKSGESSSLAFPYALVNYKGRRRLITLFTPPPLSENGDSPEEAINKAEALLEFEFASAIDKIASPKRTGIGYAIGNGEPMDQRTYDLRTTLQSEYALGLVDLKNIIRIPDSVDLLLMVKPTETFSEEEKLTIDQFVMRGGKLLWFIDNLIAEKDSLAFKPETIAYDRNLNLTDLLFKYGLRINTDLVMDLECDFIPLVIGGSQDNPQIQFLPFNYYPRLRSVKGGLPFNYEVVGQFVNSIDSIKSPGIRKQAILSSSQNSRIISTPALISLNENKTAPEDEKFKSSGIPVGMLLEGEFPSLYRNRLGKAQLDSMAAAGDSYLGSSASTSMIIVADGDIVLNDYAFPGGPGGPPEPLAMGWNKYTYTEYQKNSEFARLFIPAGNRQFLLNCIEYLTSDPAISRIRNKEIVLRQLDPKKTSKQRSRWQLINIVLPVLLVLLFGWLYQEMRKRRYA